MTTRYLIDFADTATDAEISSYFTTNTCTIVRQYTNLNKVYLVTSESISLPVTGIITSIINDDEKPVTLLSTVVTPPPYNYTTTDILVDDPTQWWKTASLNVISTTDHTLAVTRKGQYSSVYILDSGIDDSHPEFTDVVINKVWSFTGEFSDSKGHGTALASVISGKTCGISDATLKVVKVFDKNTPTMMSDLLSAFDAVLSDYMTISGQCAVVNLSWSIEKNEYIENKILFLINMGMVVVASAGNSGVPIDNVTPASMPEVITIGAYNQDFLPCDFSNYTSPLITSVTNGLVNGGVLDGWAPGQDIRAAAIAGGFGLIAGTSASAAIHSAAIAYNMTKRVTSDLLVVRVANPDGPINIKYMQRESLSRSNILDLSSPEYSASVNRITTFENNIPIIAPVMSDGESFAIAGKVGLCRIGEPEYISSVEIVDPLPPGVSVQLPSLVIDIKDEPVNPNGKDTLVFRFIITLTNGIQFEKKITIHLINSSFVPNDHPADHPINIILAIDDRCSTGACQSCYTPSPVQTWGCYPPTGKLCACNF